MTGPAEVATGKSIQLKTVSYAIDGTSPANKSVEYKSLDTNIATVSSSGKVTGKSQGTATILVSSKDGGVSEEYNVTVYPAVTAVNIKKGSDTVTKAVLGYDLVEDKGIKFTLTATNDPDGSSQKVEWSSSNTKVATVDKETGEVTITGTKAGTAKITAKALDGTGKSNYVTINVGILTRILNITGPTEVATGKSVQLKVNPKASDNQTNPTNKSVNYKSLSPDIATVSSSGKVTGKAEGDAVITVTSRDGGVKKEITVHVYLIVKEVDIKDMSGNSVVKTTLYYDAGADKNKTFTLKAVNEPSDALQKVEWTSSNTKIATVDKNTGEVTIVGEKTGTAKITAKALDGSGKSAYVNISLTKLTKDIAITGPYKVKVGSSIQLKAQAYAADYTDPLNKSVTYSSSDTNIATVSSSGKVTGKKAGTVEIIVKSKDNNCVKEFTVNVYDNESTESEEIVISSDGNKYSYLDKERVIPVSLSQDKIRFDVYMFDEDGNINRDEEYEISLADESVVELVEDSYLKPVREGETVLTARLKSNPDKYSTIKVVVKDYDVRYVYPSERNRDLGKGKTKNLKAVAYGYYDKIENAEFIYTSFNPKVATVDSKGNVKGVSIGEAVIKIASKVNPEICDYVKIAVNDGKLVVGDVVMFGPNSYIRDTLLIEVDGLNGENVTLEHFTVNGVDIGDVNWGGSWYDRRGTWGVQLYYPGGYAPVGERKIIVDVPVSEYLGLPDTCHETSYSFILKGKTYEGTAIIDDLD